MLPALTAMVSAVLILGYFLQMPGEYREGGVAAVSSLFFVGQYYFMQNTGYFDMDALYQPLLHTWSLGVEFTAYLAVFILIFFMKARRQGAALVIVAVSGIYVLTAPLFVMVSYFDPVPRIFLFFVAFYLSCQRHKLALQNYQLILISLMSFFMIAFFWGDDIRRGLWPNYSIFLFPSLVLPLILFKGDFLRFRLITDAMSRIGNWSYSIYIWHWPIIVFERIYIRNSALNMTEFWSLLLMSLVIGVVSYRYIEKNLVFLKVGLPAALALSIGVLATDGASYRAPSFLTKYSSIDLMINYDYFSEHQNMQNLDVFYVSSGIENHTTVVIGDSHSRHILPIYDAVYEGAVYNINIRPDELALRWQEFVAVLQQLDADRVIFAYRFHNREVASISAFLDKARSGTFTDDYEVLIVRDIPSLDRDPVACLFANESSLFFRGCGFNIRDGLPESHVQNRNDAAWGHILNNAGHNIALIDTHAVLCDDGLCTTMINEEFIMRDDNHFNERMSRIANRELYDLIFVEHVR